jgi:hypothetical protein
VISSAEQVPRSFGAVILTTRRGSSPLRSVRVPSGTTFSVSICPSPTRSRAFCRDCRCRGCASSAMGAMPTNSSDAVEVSCRL